MKVFRFFTIIKFLAIYFWTREGHYWPLIYKVGLRKIRIKLVRLRIFLWHFSELCSRNLGQLATPVLCVQAVPWSFLRDLPEPGGEGLLVEGDYEGGPRGHQDLLHQAAQHRLVCCLFNPILGDFFFVLYSTLLHLPHLRFHCVGWCWDRTQDRCNWCIGCQTI
jgi:hypothetical protein